MFRGFYPPAQNPHLRFGVFIVGAGPEAPCAARSTFRPWRSERPLALDAFFLGLGIEVASHVRMVYVIGGNLNEAQETIHRRQLTDAVAIDDPQLLRRLNAPQVIVTGTFIARPDVQAFYDVFRKTGAKHRFLA